MISDKEIDVALLANLTNRWQKIAFVVGTTMIQINGEQRGGRNDLYFAKRVAAMVEKGLVEYKGDLNQMRQCEVRLSPS